MDIIHYGGWHYLTLIVDFPSGNCCHVKTAIIIWQLELLFCESSPADQLIDNGAVFCGEMFTENCGIQLRFQCAYVQSENGIIERCHCTIKRIATRTQCSIMKALYSYYVAAPVNCIYNFQTHIKGVDAAPLVHIQPRIYRVRDTVWIKAPHGQCTTHFEKARVTGIYSPHLVLVYGIPSTLKIFTDLFPQKMMVVVCRLRAIPVR